VVLSFALLNGQGAVPSGARTSPNTCEPDMIDNPEDPASATDITAHAVRMASAITSNASEPAAVIANADPIVIWLAVANDHRADMQRRLAAAYQQLDNQRGVSCEVGRFLERAQELYTYLCRVDTAARPGKDPHDRLGGDS
jgi:hypothetical protein